MRSGKRGIKDEKGRNRYQGSNTSFCNCNGGSIVGKLGGVKMIFVNVATDEGGKNGKE